MVTRVRIAPILTACIAVLAGCRRPPPPEPPSFTLRDEVVLTRPDSEDAFFVARIESTQLARTPGPHVLVKSKSGESTDLGICESVSVSVSREHPSWCLLHAIEQRTFREWTVTWPAEAGAPKVARPLTVSDVTLLPSIAPEEPTRVVGNVRNDGSQPTKWVGAFAVARSATNAIVGAGLVRTGVMIAPKGSQTVTVVFTILTEAPHHVELFAEGEGT